MNEIRQLKIPAKTRDSLNNILLSQGYNVTIGTDDILLVDSKIVSDVVSYIDSAFTLQNLPTNSIWRIFNNLKSYKVISNIYLENKNNQDVYLDIVTTTDINTGTINDITDALASLTDAVTANKDIEINIVRDSSDPPRDFIQIIGMDFTTNPPTPYTPIYKTLGFLTPSSPPVEPISKVSDMVFQVTKQLVIANKTVVGKYSKRDELTKITFYYGKIRQESIWYNETTNTVLSGSVPKEDYSYIEQLTENYSNTFTIIKKAKLYTVLSSWSADTSINDNVTKVTTFNNGVRTEQWFKLTNNTSNVLDGGVNVISIISPPLSSYVLENDNVEEKIIYKLEHRENDDLTIIQEREHLYHNSIDAFGLFKGTVKWVNV